MQINEGDIFKFPNGKYQWKVNIISFSVIFLDQYDDNIITKKDVTILHKSNPFFTEKNKIYDYETGQWFNNKGDSK